VSCPLGAIEATARRWHKLRVTLVERREFQDKEDVRLYPEMEATDGEKDAFGLLPARAPILFEASGERLFLLCGLELRQQERMADANLLAVESVHDVLRQFGQAEALHHIHRTLARLRGKLLDAVLWLIQVEKRTEALRLFQRVNVAALEVFDQLRLQRFGIGEMPDADGDSGSLGHPRGAVTPCAEDDLEAALIQGTNEQWRENALAADALGQLFQGIVLEGTARVSGGLGKHGEGKVAVLGGIDDGGVHGDVLLSSG
jgi:hypothetical protein